MIKRMGFGSPVSSTVIDPARLAPAVIGYQQSITALADAIGLPLDVLEVSGEIARATEPYTLSDGWVIEQGTMGAQRLTVAGTRNGKPLISFRSHWFCTHQLDPDWGLDGEGWLFDDQRPRADAGPRDLRADRRGLLGAPRRLYGASCGERDPRTSWRPNRNRHDLWPAAHDHPLQRRIVTV